MAPLRNNVAVVGLIAVAALATSLVGPSESAASSDSDLGGTTRAVNCPIDVPDEPGIEIDCGQLTVPENYDDPEGSKVVLPYIVVGRSDRTPEPDPVVFTAGGPGYSSLSSVWGFANSPILDRRDIIVFEQRGNRFAQPSLVCSLSAWWQEEPGNTPCLDSLRAKGVDLGQYTANIMARDLIALRQALGYEQWNLYGGSFSSSLMLLLMEADEAATRSVILHSVKPPQETTFAHEADVPLRAIKHLFTACAADDGCRAAYPDLEDEFTSLVRRLNREPLTFTVTVAGLDDPFPVELDGESFIDWVMIDQLYRPVFKDFGASYLPLLIHLAADEDAAVLEGAVRAYWRNTVADSNWAWGLLLAVNCQQDLPAAGNRPAADVAASEKLDGFYRSSSQRAICEAWDLPPQPPASDHIVRSQIPTLVMAGSFDPVTPPSWSRTTADNLVNSTYVEFPGHGHSIGAANPCAGQLETTFLDDPTAQLDTACVAGTPGPSFVLPDEVYVAPGLVRSGQDVNLGEPRGETWIEAVVATGLIATLAALLCLLALGVHRLVLHRGGSDGERSVTVAVGLALLLALGVLALPLVMTDVNDGFNNMSSLASGIGPSRDWWSATILAWLAPGIAALAVAVLLLSARAWITRGWTLASRIVVTFTALAALPILLLGLRWDFYTML